jgi:hypothetical protein
MAERVADTRLTHSQIRTARRCLREYQLSYEIGLRRVSDSQPLRFGHAFHAGLELRATGVLMPQVIEQTLAEYDKHKPAANEDGYEDHLYDRVKLAVLLNAYDWRWAAMDKEVKPIEVERPFNVPIINPVTGRAMRLFSQAGKRDSIVLLADGRIALWEAKTTSKDIDPLGDYWKRLRIDSQISSYYVAAQLDGVKLNTVIYDVIRKPTIGPAILTQAQTAALIETGEYNAKVGDTVTMAGTAQATVTNGWVTLVASGERALVIEGKRGFAIRETPTLYSMRLAADIGARPDYYFQRREVPRLESDLEETRHEIWASAKLIHHCKLTGVWPRNDDACIGNYVRGTCPYFEQCTSGYVPTSGIVPDGFRITENIHEELEEV